MSRSAWMNYGNALLCGARHGAIGQPEPVLRKLQK